MNEHWCACAKPKFINRATTQLVTWQDIGRCSVLIQTKDLEKHCLSLYSSFLNLLVLFWLCCGLAHTFVFIYRHVSNNSAVLLAFLLNSWWLSVKLISILFFFFSFFLAVNRVTSRILIKWMSPLTRSSVMKTCLPHLGVTWIMVKFRDRVPLEDIVFLVLYFNVTVDLPSDDMPDLQEVEEDQRSPGLYHLGTGVSHQEFGCSPSTNWLAELANIATSPQSPLLKNIPHKRFDMCMHIFIHLLSAHQRMTWTSTFHNFPN